ncbi:flocculation protein FLO11-like, partial [Aphis craccivora]
MHVKIAVILFAVTTLIQQSHCIPTHRYVRATSREGQDWTSRIKEYLNKIPGYGSSGSQSPSSSTSQPDSSSYQQGANAGSESTSEGAAAGTAGAASEPEVSIAAKEGSTSSSGLPSYTDYMPSQLSNYQSSFPNP